MAAAPKIRLSGFERKGSRYWRDGGATREVVELQVGRGGTAVAINYGIRSQTLATVLETDVRDGTYIDDCHWHDRARGDDGHELWIPLDDTAQIDEVLKAQVLPELQAHSSESALRDSWRGGTARGIGDMQRLTYLAVLLKSLGPESALAEVLNELRAAVQGTVHERLTERRLARAGIAWSH